MEEPKEGVLIFEPSLREELTTWLSIIACSNQEDFFVEFVLFEVAVDEKLLKRMNFQKNGWKVFIVLLHCAVETEAGSVFAIGVELKDVSFDEVLVGGCNGVACRL